jgi:hypothetical protein
MAAPAPVRGELSVPQQRALAVLIEGKALKEAAEGAGVNRSTLYRWIRQDAAFAAAYNAWQQEAAESARARMHASIHLAVERVIRCMENDQDLSFKVIKEMGILKPRAAGQIDADRLRQEMALEQRDLARRFDEAAEPPARRIVSQVTTTPSLPTAEPVAQSPPTDATSAVTSETNDETSA